MTTAGVGCRIERAAASDLPPAPSTDTLLGAWLDDDDMALAVLTHCAAQGPPVLAVPFGTRTGYLVVSPSLISEVLHDDIGRFQRDENFLQAYEPLLGEGLITTRSQPWRPQRRWVHAAVRGALTHTVSAAVDGAVALAQDWTACRRLDLVQALARLHWRVLVSAMLGDPDYPRPISADGPNEVVGWPELKQFLADPAHSPCGRRPQPAKSGGRMPLDDAATALAQSAGPCFTTQQVNDEVVTLLFAGHDTTLSALVWTFVVLAENPDAQQRVAEEARLVLAGRIASQPSLKRLDYCQRAVQEALRLRPPTALITREPVVDITLGGYRIPAGATLLLSPWATHRDPRLFTDPLAFEPDRWLEATLPDAYFPFGTGPRMCVGRSLALAEVAAVVATVLARCEVRLAGPAPAPRLRDTVMPAGPVPIRAKARP